MTLLVREVPHCDARLTFTDMDLHFLTDFAADAALPAPCDLVGAMLLVTLLGGYRNRKHDPPPGHQLMWRGYERMGAATLGYQIALRQFAAADSPEPKRRHSIASRHLRNRSGNDTSSAEKSTPR